MARYIATVEFQDGEYFTSFPGIEKAYSTAKRVEDIDVHEAALNTSSPARLLFSG